MPKGFFLRGKNPNPKIEGILKKAFHDILDCIKLFWGVVFVYFPYILLKLYQHKFYKKMNSA